MTDEEKDALIAKLEERCRRWRSRARRIVEAIADKDQAWADRILEGWEHDSDVERTAPSGSEVKESK